MLAGRAVAERAAGSGIASIKVARPQIFDGTSSKVSGLIIACRLYIRMKIREVAVEEQIQWILSYM